MRRRAMRRGQRERSGNWRADYLETRTVGSEEGGWKRAARAVPRQPPILLQTSVRKIDSLVFHHPPIFLRHVILNHGRSRKIFLVHERKTLLREKRALPGSIHSWKSCKGCNIALPNASSHMT